MHLGPINEDTYIDFCRNMFASRERSIDADPIRTIYNIFEGNTFYLQRAMNGAFADTPRHSHCDNSTVIRSVHEMIAANEVIFREILSNVTINQKATLYAIAKARYAANPMSGTFIKDNALKSASSVQSALIKLQTAGLISKSESGYFINDPLLRLFITNLYSTPEI